jgi:hypothetical protein
VLALTLLLLAAQDTLPTVGDTLWAARRLTVPAGVALRPRPARVAGPVEPLGAPEVQLVEGEVVVRYPLVAWEPGRHTVTLPGAILVRDDGWSDTLPDWTAVLEVASVLPAGPRDSLPVQPAVGVVPRSGRSPLPVLLLGSLAILALAPLHWAWRRRGPSVLAPTSRPALPSPPLLANWADRGELRAAIEGWRLHLETRQRGPLDPAVLALLEELRQARYGPRSDRELADLCRRAAGQAGGVVP